MPFGFALAFLGLFLPAVMVTSCDKIVVDVSTADFALGRDVGLKTAEAREAVGADVVAMDVEPWAIVLAGLVVAGAVVVILSGARRPWLAVPIAVAAMAAGLLLHASVSSDDFLDLVGEEGSFGLAGGSYVIALGLWLAVTMALLSMLGKPRPEGFIVINVILLILFLLMGAASAVDVSGGLYPTHDEWDSAAPFVSVVTLLELALASAIWARRKASTG
jgi:hypothetical protein